MDEIFIIKTDNVKITNENSVFKIEFNFAAYSLINSLIKTRIIQGGSTDDTYKNIIFKAKSVKSLVQYQNEMMKSIFLLTNFFIL